MSLLSEIETGKKQTAQIHVITGDNGVGKTTWAASHPSPLIADLENGSKHLDVARIPAEKLPKLSDIKALIETLLTQKHEYKTFVIDSIESLEMIIADAVCEEGGVKSIELYEKGFGKGFQRSRELMREIMMELHKLKAKGITVILVGHTQVKSKTDPVSNETYDRVIMRCNDKMASLIRDLADNVFYAAHKVVTAEKNGKTRAYSDGQRVLYTQFRAGFDSKNRLDLPFELPLSYDAFVEACATTSPEAIGTLLQEIKDMAEGVDAKLKTSVQEMLAKYSTNPIKLREVRTRLMKYANQ
jgi:hypothetical protein